MTEADPLEPHQLNLDIPVEMGDVEVLAVFMAYSKGGTVDPTSAEFKLNLGVPLQGKYEAMKVTDHPGSLFHVVVLQSTRPAFEGDELDEDDL